MTFCSNIINNPTPHPQTQTQTISLGTTDLTLHSVEAVARRGARVIMAPEARALVERSRAGVEAAMGPGKRPVYGVNTGFGALAEREVPPHELRHLQLNLLRSHACGLGPLYPAEVVRGMLLLRAQVLALGHSGVRPELIELIMEMLNRGIHPLVPSKGSVGASGDLAPLAHLALVVVGEGEAEVDGEVLDGAAALASRNLEPMVLQAKEGLALINGTQAMTACGVLTLLDACRLCKVADIAAAMSIEALMGSHRPADSRLATIRRHPGHGASAANLRKLLAHSQINSAHKNCSRVQDAYSLRCAPQVHGAVRDSLSHIADVLSIEINAITDNPIVFLEDPHTDPHASLGIDVVSGGNFHGEPVAFAMDYLAMGVAELANISDRRMEQMINPASNFGLPAFLGVNPGLDSGFMIAQVAGASLVSENKVLAHPASVDSIPTSAGREDHVSMGTLAASKARTILDNTTMVLAVELAAAARGIDVRQPCLPGKGVQAAHEVIRSRVAPHTEDRSLRPDLLAIEALIREGTIVDAVEKTIGSLL